MRSTGTTTLWAGDLQVAAVALSGRLQGSILRPDGFEADDRFQAYGFEAYDPDDYRRLTQLDAAYDPTNIFRGTHNIPPAR